jgi:amino-acid N-acetyltransferase
VSYTTEPARPEDLAAALELLRRALLPDHGVKDGFGRYLVVRDAGRLVGLAGLETHGRDALLRSVVVDAQYRGEGIGRALLDGAYDLARRDGVARLYLLTTSAHDWFARAGFSDCPRDQAPQAIRGSWEFQQGCPTSAAFMSREVPAA